jgi:hypothetical protein
MNLNNILTTILILLSGIMVSAAKGIPAKNSAPQPALTLQAQCGAPFQDNGVLQQNMPLPVWGTSLPGAKVTVGFETQNKNTPEKINHCLSIVAQFQHGCSGC